MLHYVATVPSTLQHAAGNRFYQSLGNIQADPRIALLFVCFESGDALYITGVARNLFGEEAAAMMPRSRLLTHVRVSAAVHIAGAIRLAVEGRETLSPYNPPVMYLACELAARGRIAVATNVGDTSGGCTATLVAVNGVCDGVRRFTFSLHPPLAFAPGAHIVFDLSAHFDTQYRHMNDAKPRTLNDDCVRAWTISSSPPVHGAAQCAGRFGPAATIECTVRRVDGGMISTALHSLPLADPPALKLRVLGVCGSFSCFDSDESMSARRPMLWISGGVGITPFLSMHRALVELPSTADVVWLASCRAADAALIIAAIGAHPLLPNLSMTIFLTSCDDDPSAATAAAAVTAAAAAAAELRGVLFRRLSESDVGAVTNVSDRLAFISAPNGLASAASAWCLKAGVAQEHVRKESFVY